MKNFRIVWANYCKMAREADAAEARGDEAISAEFEQMHKKISETIRNTFGESTKIVRAEEDTLSIPGNTMCDLYVMSWNMTGLDVDEDGLRKFAAELSGKYPDILFKFVLVPDDASDGWMSDLPRDDSADPIFYMEAGTALEG